ncbi:MAG: hypothetical protein IKB38_07520 [Clostridia bacterium]|nr:hypothetical protein [Clostridia bacterium]
MKNTKKSLVSRVIALVLCFSMLLGSSYAWFTDSAISEGNVIKSGNLDVEMYWSDTFLAADSAEWKNADGVPVFTYDNWEPGYTEVKYVKVKNAGNLSLRWRLSIEAEGLVTDLADVIDVYYINPVSSSVNTLEDRSSSGVLSEVLGGHKATEGVLLPEGESSPLYTSGEAILAVAFHMQEDAGNAYQGMSIGDGFKLKLIATQFNYESDVFGPDYDKDSQWPNEEFTGNSASVSVVPTADSKVSSAVSMTSSDGAITADVPAGVKLQSETSKLTLKVGDVSDSRANITLSATEAALSIDVHIDGVAEDNDVVMTIGIKELLPVGLNMGNYRFYHVEDGVTVEMILLADGATPAHNNYEYDPATGDVVLYLKSFSEVALVADTENAWQGTVASAFAGGKGTEDEPYLIANADQLVYFGDLISNENETYGNKYYKLLADINLGGEENANKGNIFYPIGYTAVGGELAALGLDDAPEFLYFEEDPDYARGVVSAASEEAAKWYTYGGSFKGVFDGNGNRIRNIYQNTWLMKGNYSGNYWNAAMGIFGYVNGGTVKNLTVDNFSSDGEFTPTGVIAAYATNSTFENIAIINCNPRVYNTGNGGIVGIGGNSDDPDSYKLTFTNITIDNTNKISALWGSWDVACGGLVGMFRGAGHVYMTNCHVGAQIDVYNDVCGNYQYYWYRYSGMMIGTNKNMITDANGYTVPETDKFHAEDCTVHFGDWNDYYYCELVANSLASYTHDHQFSRLEQIQSVSEIQDANGNWNRTGNFILMNGKTPTDTCYHIVKNAEGALVQHNHADAGEEVVGGNTVLKENNQRVYLPFNQLFTGYGWGVKHIPVYNGEDYAFEGITILDRTEADSEDKFEAIINGKGFETETTLTLGEIFRALDGKQINLQTLKVFVSPVGEGSTVSAVYTPNAEDWTLGTLTFSGIGAAKITITDYTYCKEAVTSVTIFDHPAKDKFVANGNLTFEHVLEGDTVNKTLGDIFFAVDGAVIDSENVIVTVDSANGAECVFVQDLENWAESTLAFTGVGAVTVTVTDQNYCKVATATVAVANPEETDVITLKFPNVNKYLYRVGNKTEIKLDTLFAAIPEYATATVVFETVSGNVSGAYNNGNISFTGTGVVNITVDTNAFTVAKTLTVEVINATNITSATGTTAGGDMVLLCDVNTTTYVNYWNCTLYGNGFTYSLNGAPTDYNSKQGHGILITQNAVLDNLVIIGDVYDSFGAYKDNPNYNAAIDVQGPTIIQNCYIANCATPVKARNNVTITNSTLYGGTVANLIILSGTVTLEDVTTVNYSDGRELVGMGIVIHSDVAEGAKLVINGTLTQYNFISESDEPNDDTAKILYDAMFDESCSKYHYGNAPDRYVNTGIISMSPNFTKGNIEDNASTGYEGLDVTINKIPGFVYTQPNMVGSVNNDYDYENDAHKASVQGDYLPTPEFDLGDQAVSGEDTYIKGDINGVEIRYMQGETPLTLDITKLMTVYKYGGVYYAVSAICKDANGNIVNTFANTGSYTLVFTVEDNEFYNPDGTKSDKSVTRTYEVPISVIVAEPTIKDAVITIKNAAQSGSYSGLTDKTISFNPLNAITITDAEGTVNLTTNIASTNIVYASSSSAYAGETTITVTYSDGRVLEIKLGKPTLNSPGSSKAITYANDGTIKSAAAVASKSATGGTWTVTSYSFKGANGKTVTNNTVVTFTFPDKSCVTGDTLVTLADGTQKRIDEVTYADQLLVWNFFEGKYDVVPSAIIFYHGDAEYDILNLEFEDGTVVKVINNHGFYCVEENKFVFISEANVQNYIGYSFVKVNGDAYSSVKLVDYEITQEYTGCYSIQTAMHNNFITEGMFSLTIPHYDGWFDYFEIGEGMKYDGAKMQADIDTYGLYDYEEFAEYVTYEQFVAFNGPYLKVLVGKGIVTYDQIIELISLYVNPNE